MPKKVKVGAVHQAINKLIEDEFGSTTANLYAIYFAEKPEKVVVKETEDLLSEILGPKKAKEKLKNIKQK